MEQQYLAVAKWQGWQQQPPLLSNLVGDWFVRLWHPALLEIVDMQITVVCAVCCHVCVCVCVAALTEHLIDHHLSDCPDCPAADESILSIWHISMLFPPNAQIQPWWNSLICIAFYWCSKCSKCQTYKTLPVLGRLFVMIAQWSCSSEQHIWKISQFTKADTYESTHYVPPKDQ